MATNKVSRVIDAMSFAEQTDQLTAGTAFTINDFGTITSGQLTFTDDLRVINGMRGGNQAHLSERIVGLKQTPTGTMSYLPNSLTFFKYFISDYSDDGTTYIMNNRDAGLPTALTLRGNVNETEAVQLVGSYLNNCRLTLNDEDILSVSNDIIGIKPTAVDATVSYSAPTEDPLIFCNGVFTYAGTEMDLQSINMTLDPKFIQKFGIRSTTATNKRLPSQILRGGKTVISFDGTANLTGDATNQLEQIWGGANPPDEIADVTMTLVFTQGSKTHTITLTGKTGPTGLAYTDSEENSKTITFSGSGTDFQVTGTL